MSHKEQSFRVSDLKLDQSNPRFSAVNSQRDAINAMIADQGDKIVSLAAEIYQNGLNPSSKPIIFKEGSNYIDGDGNRRLTALKILETPSLADSYPKIRKKIDSVLKENGKIPSEVSCVVFKNRESARHWISINHGGEQDGKGQITWNSEQKNRFDGKASIGLEALDHLIRKKMIKQQDKDRVNKSTLDRLLSYKDVKSDLSISKKGDQFVFGNAEHLQKVVLSLKDKAVDQVYTAVKGRAFVQEAIASSTSTYPNRKSLVDSDNPSVGARNQGVRSRRIKNPGLPVFGGKLLLKSGHINNLYRDVEKLYDFYQDEKSNLTEDFIAIFRMALRLLAETAGNDQNFKLDKYLDKYFDDAMKSLDKNTKTTLSAQNVKKNSITQLFQTGAHNYHNSKNEEQALALSIILGAMLTLSHGKKA